MVLSMFDRKSNLDMIRYYWPKGNHRERDFKQIKELYKCTLKDGEKVIDDQTWSDLDMDRVFTDMDKNYSTPGQQALYNMLRRPLYTKEELLERQNLIETLEKDVATREKIQIPLFKLGYQKRGETLDLLNSDLKGDKWKLILYTVLGLIPIALLISAFLLECK